jgi:wyosine [tRNA(Phe)-imidazoG37] synthetase (radical SAM superfamily)
VTERPPQTKLSVNQHDRDSAGMQYVYPVVSRRAGGVSVGINLNPNNACNWRCAYCQVEGLHRGAAPPIDVPRLEEELRSLLSQIVHGDFLRCHVPKEARELRDLALSGNGEPTSSPQLLSVLQVIGRVRADFALGPQVPTVLITNGSLVERQEVGNAIRQLRELSGIVWFKVDGGTDERLAEVNGTHTRLSRHLSRLAISASLCETFVQSCWFRRANVDPPAVEVDAYVSALGGVVRHGVPLAGVWLYTIARPCLQPGGTELTMVSHDFLYGLARRLTDEGLRVRVAP